MIKTRMIINYLKYKYNTILIIDDNEVDNFISQKLVELNHFAEKTHIFTTCKDALEFIKKLTVTDGVTTGTYPDIIFVDLNMPVMNGFEFISIFKKLQDAKLKKCRIVILTSSVSDQDKIRVERMEVGAAFISKPLTDEILKKL
jgi:CheY-like chemotaxis protein